MAEPLTEDDIKFYLSIEPDEEAVRKAVEQINRDIENEKIRKIKLEMEAMFRPKPLPEPPPQPFLQKRFGRPGEIAQGFLDQTDYGGAFRQVTRGLKGDESLGGMFKGVGKQIGADLKSVWQGLTGAGGKVAAGAAAEAAAGPAGIAVAAAAELAKGIGQLATAPFQAVNKGLGMLRRGLQDMQGPLGGIGAGISLVGDLFDMVGERINKIPIVGQLLGPVINQLSKMPEALKQILQIGTQLAEKASPGHIRQLGIAIEDAMATIGQAFLPVIEEMIPVIREIGTAIAQGLPSDQEMRQMFRELFESIKDLVKELAPLAGPMLKVIVSSVKAIADVMTLLAKVFGPIFKPILAVVNVVVSVFGALVKALTAMVDGVRWAIRQIPIVGKWLVGDDSEGKEKRGAISSARPAWMGGIQEYQTRLQMQTATGSAGSESVPQNVNNLARSVANIEAWFAKMTPEQIRALAAGQKPDGTRQVADAAERGARG